MRMERVPIQLGTARGAAGSAAKVSSVGGAVSGTAAASSAVAGGLKPAAEVVPTRVAAAAAVNSSSVPGTTSVSNGRGGVASGQQLGKRPIGRAAEQQPGKRPARPLKTPAVPTISAVNAPTKAPAVAPPSSQLPAENGASNAVGSWECIGCKRRNRAEDKRCRQCEGLRLVGAEVALKVAPASAPAPVVSDATAAAAAAAIAAAARASVASKAAPATAPADAAARVRGDINVSGNNAPTLPSPKPVSSPATIELPTPSESVVKAASTPHAASRAASAFVRTATRIASKKPAGAIAIAPKPVGVEPDTPQVTTQAAVRAYAAAKSTTRSSQSASGSQSSPWGCRACSTINKDRAVACVSCGTRKKVKDVVKEGKPEWWCCRKCSRFNNYIQEGSTCRFCNAAQKSDGEPENAEDDEEAVSVDVEEEISVGGEKPGLAAASSMSGIAAAPAGRFVQL